MVASMQDKVGSWYINLETDVVGSTITSGRVGKYLKALTAGSVDVTGNVVATDDSSENRQADCINSYLQKSFIVL
jgi:peptidyl-prolyl cis-trans isomerase-like 2